MKYAFFQGCNIPIRIEQYAEATTALFGIFDIELEKIPEFNCCGYPVRNVDEKAYILPSVRNLAIAEKRGLDIMVICNCCFASLQKTRNVMHNNPPLMAELNTILAKEGLHYSGTTEVKHYLTALYEDVGPEKIKSRRVSVFAGLNIAVIQGCHILRPREITRFDDSFVPRITEELLATTGVTSLDWRGKLECCGAALAGIDNDPSHRLLKEKITGAKAAGADYITPICSYCHLQFDTTQMNILSETAGETILPVLLLPQILGLCLGIDLQSLGISENSTVRHTDILRILSLLGPPATEKMTKKAKVVA